MEGMTSREGIDAGVFRSMVDRLVEVLRTHLDRHRKLLSVMERKKDACVAARTGDLEGIVVEERTAIEAIAESERDRGAAAADLGALLGLAAPSRLRLLDLLQRVGEEHREDLLDLRDELRDVADAIDRLNRLNRTLILHSLEHVHLFMVLLKGADPEARTYGKDGGEGAQQAPVLVDRRI